MFTLFLADFFDTMGTLVGVGRQAGYLDERGEMPEIGKPLLVDSAAAAAGGFASASSATTYIESASGVGVGGRTGWVSVVTGVLFFPFMFIAPLIGGPPQATAPALIIVGWLMISVLTEAEEEAEVVGDQLRHDQARASPVDRRPTTPERPPGRHRLPRHRPRPFRRDRDHVHAVHVLDHGRHRRRLHRLRVDPDLPGPVGPVHPLMFAAAFAFALYFAIPILQQEFDWI